MSSIFTLLNLIAQIGLAGLGVMLIYAFFKEQKIKESRNEVQMLQARISMLRISLRAKVKKKSNGFRNLFNGSVVPDDPVDKLLTTMANLPFEKSNDFETYFALNHEINSHLKHQEILDPNQQLAIAQNNKLKISRVDELNTSSDPAIYKIIREISATSQRLRVSIENYNVLDKKNPFPEDAVFKFMTLKDIKKTLKESRETKKFHEKNDTSARITARSA